MQCCDGSESIIAEQSWIETDKMEYKEFKLSIGDWTKIHGILKLQLQGLGDRGKKPRLLHFGSLEERPSQLELGLRSLKRGTAWWALMPPKPRGWSHAAGTRALWRCWKRGKLWSAAAGRTGTARGKGLGGEVLQEKKQSRHRVQTGQSKPCAFAQPSRSSFTPHWQSLATCRVAKQKCVCRVPVSGSPSGVTESGFETKTNWQLH